MVKVKKMEVFGIPTSTNEAYGKVVGGERNETHEQLDVQKKRNFSCYSTKTGGDV